MSGPDVMFPEEQRQITNVCQRLHRDSNAKAVLLIGRDGQAIAEAGEVGEIDVTSLSSLTAGNVAVPDYAIYASTDNDLLIVAGDAATLAQPLADVFREPGLAKELRTVHLQNLADLQIRKVATRATIHPLVQSYPVPANSDYYPYLDLNAARYRFLQQGAGDLAGLNAAGVPVIAMLEGSERAAAGVARRRRILQPHRADAPRAIHPRHLSEAESARAAGDAARAAKRPRTRQPARARLLGSGAARRLAALAVPGGDCRQRVPPAGGNGGDMAALRNRRLLRLAAAAVQTVDRAVQGGRRARRQPIWPSSRSSCLPRPAICPRRAGAICSPRR